ncbi:hypothetical protein [Chryseobacterium indoltheticum]|jgi:predicted transglutaminase-like protease|uniref:hypothetical protein n=1 Tax=Chryseobacterium indoltheticum TaxID=254 RepID=UPI00242C1D92|nr:hypothetical protein [Chryseobacterium indoltheticum]MDF2831067.1 helicase UvrD [Chryseobacterium indoltheticum]
MESDEGYIIVDFKTGMETEKNDRQIETYKSVLENLGMKGAQNAADLALIKDKKQFRRHLWCRRS